MKLFLTKMREGINQSNCIGILSINAFSRLVYFKTNDDETQTTTRLHDFFVTVGNVRSYAIPTLHFSSYSPNSPSVETGKTLAVKLSFHPVVEQPASISSRSQWNTEYQHKLTRNRNITVTYKPRDRRCWCRCCLLTEVALKHTLVLCVYILPPPLTGFRVTAASHRRSSLIVIARGSP